MTIRALDMFCGAGGSSCGARDGGATIVGAIDAWDLAARTHRDNHPDATVQVRRLGPTSRPGKEFHRERIELLLASPECTNHSPAKGSAERCEDSRGTANYVLNFARELQPRWLVIENVVQMRDWSGFPRLLERLDCLGYELRVQTLDASNFGVPQSRKRLFVLGDLLATPPEIIAPSRVKQRNACEIVDWNGPWQSTLLYSDRRAVATIERAERAIAALGTGIPFLIVYYGSDGGGGWQSLDRPIRTLTTLDRFGLVTWKRSTPLLRMLQVGELKRAMGFPDDYEFGHGNRRDRIRMLGNGVCPPVMAAVIRQLTANIGMARRLAA